MLAAPLLLGQGAAYCMHAEGLPLSPCMCGPPAGFSARTVDYDADSDSSSDEFVFVEERPTALPSSGPAAAAEPGPPASSQDDASSDEEEAAAEMSEGADEEDFEPDEEDEDEDDEPPLPASSGDGPIVEYSPSTSWWGSQAQNLLLVPQGQSALLRHAR